MSAEFFFADVVRSYRELLSSSATDIPCLRDYCRSRHVAWRAFTSWASSHPLAHGLLSPKPAGKPGKVSTATIPCSSKVTLADKPLLHRLNILSSGQDDSSVLTRESNLLRGVRIIFPNGVKVSIAQATANDIFSLVHSETRLK